MIAGNCTSDSNTTSAGIVVTYPNTLSILAKVTVNAKGGRVEDSLGIFCDELIKKATIKASSADAATCSYGIDSRSVSIYSKEGR